jgi:methylenetetrahydrofolate dehydrogenase (NADP+)/methenyltetrahydrofolate cyclohydrolase
MKGKIDGETVARKIESELEEAEETPKLHIILVGNREASKTFVKQKLKAAERVGFNTELTEFKEDVEQKKLIQKIEELNMDDSVDGIIVQLPLPRHINENQVFESLSSEKDVDCLTPENLGRLVRGHVPVHPAAAEGIMEILSEYDVPVEGSDVVIVNNSALVGRPLSMLLTEKNATVTLCNKETEDLELHVSEADIVVTATGEPGVIDAGMISEDSVVIDAGYGSQGGDIEEIEGIAEKALLAPVPHGLGPVTVAVTLRNLLKCYRLQN